MAPNSLELRHRSRRLVFFVLLFGLALGFGLSQAPLTAEASRNAAGTYSLPNSPVVSGSVITSAGYNTTLSDLRTEMTDSLSRSGKGAMLAPLEIINGSVGTPAFSFDSDNDTGIYRPDAGDIGFAVDGVLVCQMHGGGVTFTKAISAVGSGGTPAGQFTGNGVGSGVYGSGGDLGGTGIFGTGGQTDGDGVTGVGGATNGSGVVGTGAGSGYGGIFEGGGSSGFGVSASGGTGNGIGLYAQGTGSQLGITAVGGPSNGRGIRTQGGGTASGLLAIPGTAATATVPAHAIETNNGDILVAGTPPNADVAMTNTLTNKNIPKAWALITIAGSGSQSVAAGFNVASIACGSSAIQVTFASAFASTNYAVIPGGTNNARIIDANRVSTTRTDFQFRDNAGTLLDPCGVFSQDLYFVAFGVQ